MPCSKDTTTIVDAMLCCWHWPQLAHAIHIRSVQGITRIHADAHRRGSTWCPIHANGIWQVQTEQFKPVPKGRQFDVLPNVQFIITCNRTQQAVTILLCHHGPMSIACPFHPCQFLVLFRRSSGENAQTISFLMPFEQVQQPFRVQRSTTNTATTKA